MESDTKLLDILNLVDWQILLTILALITPVALYFFFQRNKKLLSYEIIDRTPLLTTKEEIQGKLKILYNDVKVQNVTLFNVKIINSGNVPIASEDFESKIKIKFPIDSKILSIDDTKYFPKNLNPIIELDGTTVLISPFLINPKDYFIIKFIVSDIGFNDFTIDSRIKGVKEINHLYDPKKGSKIIFYWSIIWLILSLIVILIQLWNESFNSTIFFTWFILTFIGYIFLLVKSGVLRIR